MPLPDTQPKVLCDLLPPGMRGAVLEEPIMPRRVNFEPIASDDTGDIAFLDNLCQKMWMLLTGPASYRNVLIELSILYHTAQLINEPVHTTKLPESKSTTPHITYTSQIALLQTDFPSMQPNTRSTTAIVIPTPPKVMSARRVPYYTPVPRCHKATANFVHVFGGVRYTTRSGS
jgi:hypothetical protein